MIKIIGLMEAQQRNMVQCILWHCMPGILARGTRKLQPPFPFAFSPFLFPKIFVTFACFASTPEASAVS